MKKILLIGTGGTIASRHSENGLSPAISAEDIVSFVPDLGTLCEVETVQPFSLDSTNVGPDQWLALASLIEKRYADFDGFVITHGTDTMAYTAAALSYLIQHSPKPIVLTGAQKPIDLPDTDARTNLLDSVRFALDGRASDVSIVFGGQAIAGTRAKKERSKSYNAFASINYPPVAILQEDRIGFYIDGHSREYAAPEFFHGLDTKVFLHKLIPGDNGTALRLMRDAVDAVVVESFGVGGLPETGGDGYFEAVSEYIAAGKQVVMATQVVHEGSDMSIYEVGKRMKSRFDLPESYDMTLEACVTKTMWALAVSRDPDRFRSLFYTPVNHDLLFAPRS